MPVVSVPLAGNENILMSAAPVWSPVNETAKLNVSEALTLRVPTSLLLPGDVLPLYQTI